MGPRHLRLDRQSHPRSMTTLPDTASELCDPRGLVEDLQVSSAVAFHYGYALYPPGCVAWFGEAHDLSGTDAGRVVVMHVTTRMNPRSHRFAKFPQRRIADPSAFPAGAHP